MKTTNCAYLVLLVYGIISFELPVSCDPTNESQQDERLELIDVDIKNIDSDKLEVLKSQERLEVRKIAPKNNKIIKSINIDEDVIWKKSATSICVNFLLFLTNGDKIFIVLNTKSDFQKFYINLVYDPTESVGSGISDAGLGGNKIRYIGLLPFIIELNEEFGVKKRDEGDLGCVELNIEDFFDKLYHNYSTKTINLHESSGKYSLVYDVYEPNGKDCFSEIRNNKEEVWSSLEEEETMKRFLKRVEVYSKESKKYLLKLISTYDLVMYLVYDSKRNYFRKTDKGEFDKKFKELGFTESIKEIQSTAQISSDESVIETLDIGGINKENFHFIRRKLSSVRIVTVVPKQKRRVKEFKYGESKPYSIESDDFTIDFIKWYDNKYNSEIIVRNDEYNYNCHYTEQRKDDVRMYYYDQEVFYEFMKTRIVRKEHQHITYTPFKYLYYSKDTIYAPSSDAPPPTPVQSVEQEKLSGSSLEQTPARGQPETSQKSPDTNQLTVEEIEKLSTHGIQTSVITDDVTVEINKLKDASIRKFPHLNKKQGSEETQATSVGENMVDLVEKMIQDIEKLGAKVEGEAGQITADGLENRKVTIDDVEKNQLEDSLEFLKTIKNKYGGSKSEPSPKEQKTVVENKSPVRKKESGFLSTGFTITLLIITSISIW